MLDPHNEVTKIPQTVMNYSSKDIGSHPRRLKSSAKHLKYHQYYITRQAMYM
jgi:hypothetical protein